MRVRSLVLVYRLFVVMKSLQPRTFRISRLRSRYSSPMWLPGLSKKHEYESFRRQDLRDARKPKHRVKAPNEANKHRTNLDMYAKTITGAAEHMAATKLSHTAHGGQDKSTARFHNAAHLLRRDGRVHEEREAACHGQEVPPVRVRHRPAVFLGNVPQHPQPLHQQAVDSDPILEAHGNLIASGYVPIVTMFIGVGLLAVCPTRPCGVRAGLHSQEQAVGCGWMDL